MDPACKTPTNPSLKVPGVLLATWFGAGYLPKAPGTWGSAAALPFAWWISTSSGPTGLLIASVVMFAVGIWASDVFIALSGRQDPGPVVIDEVAGQWLTLAFVPPDLLIYGVGFLLFRVADIFKPWPACWADQKVKGGMGVMLDDVLAAIYSGGALYALHYSGII